VILRRHWFCSFSRGARELFASGLPLRPMPQIWAPYSIVGLTTAVYSSRVRLKESSDCIGLDWTGFKLESSPSNSFRIRLLELQGNPMQIYTINSKS
jgi:hypothetical protein